MNRILSLGTCIVVLVASAKLVIAQPPAPATEHIVVNLESLPRQTFAGIFQKDPPQPRWTLEHEHPLG